MKHVAQTLNQTCHCRSVNPALLSRHLDMQAGLPGFAEDIGATRPHLFSSSAIFLSRETAGLVHEAVEVLERVIASDAYQAAALAGAAPIARHAFGPRGVFMGFDFHLDDTGPRLIEINTNAGGGLLNAALARASQACCEAADWAFIPDASLPQLEDTFHAMFLAEWRSQRGDLPLRSVAIVDDAPASQYLAPEFTLCQRLLETRGLQAFIADPRELRWHGGRLWHGDAPIDLVYNRLTDFYLAEASHAALRAAYEAGAVVMTPHPRAHALYADKRNLVALSDDALLASWGVTPADRQRLAAIVPRTVAVTADQAETLWRERRQWFFKPVAGYASKGAYRGDKVTRRVWEEIQAGGYIAQAIVPPGERLVAIDSEVVDLKFDLRAYVYAGRLQLMAGRMYQGQTTNFRTAGGGFAPVVVLPASAP